MSDSMFRLTAWSVRKIGGITLLTFILLLIIFGSLTFSLAGMASSLSSRYLLSIAFLALVTGWLLGRSSIKGWRAGLLSVLLGLIIVVITTGGLAEELLTLLAALGLLGWDYLRRTIDEPLPDSVPTLVALQNLGFELVAIYTRVFYWTQALINGANVYDPLAANLIWGLSIWAVAIWAGWALRRRGQPLVAVLPAAALFAISHALTWSTSITMVPVLIAIFLLLVWTNFNNHRRRWHRVGTDYAEDIYYDLALWGWVVTVMIVFAAMTVSFISPQNIYKSMQQIAQRTYSDTRGINESLGLDPPTFPEYEQEASIHAAGLPRDHLVGSGPELERQVAMVITVEDPLRHSAPDQSMPSYYWRTLTYDVYTGRGWETSATETIEYRANEAADANKAAIADGAAKAGETVEMLAAPEQRLIRQEVLLGEALRGLLYTAGNLVTADLNYQVAWRPTPEDSADAFGITIAADVSSYLAESQVLMVGEEQLRSAGETYPSWVLERYLQLPESLPPQIGELSRNLTAHAATPYDKAIILESYLRDFPYTLDVPTPPRERDVAAFFLFDLQEGYCDYYATTMVVMARSIGLPARLAIGYGMGYFDEEQDRYIVTEADAHSWVEIYFPDVGWVDFEPTGGIPAIERPFDIPYLDIPELESSVETNPARLIAKAYLDRLGWVVAMVAFLGVALLIWSFSDAWRLRKKSSPAALTALYRRLHRQGKRLKAQTQPEDTPHDLAISLSEQIEDLSKSKRWEKRLSPASEEAQQLVDHYAEAVYSQHPPGPEDQAHTIQIWQRLRWRLWLARAIRRLKGTKRGK